MTTTGKPRVSSTRIAADTATVLEQLGLLADLSGTWAGTGFNLIARPDFHDNANLYLQLSQTHETLTVEPLGSAIPNRGFGQDDIEMFGLSYLDKISDLKTSGALHFEPGLWVTQPPTSYPPETAEPGEQLVFRMGSIPHGNALLAEGTASAFTGPPTLPDTKGPYAFSTFPSFNSTPFPVGTPINAAGTSELANAPGGGFTQYTLTNPATQANPRTPFDEPSADALPADINGVPMQTVVNDPITLLQAVIKQQVADGSTFSGVALNVATQAQVPFLNTPNVSGPNAPSSTVDVIAGGGGIKNISFLDGGEPTPGSQGANAHTALVYATFWIEQVTPKNHRPFMQLQYAQFTELDFEIFAALHGGGPGGPGGPAGPGGPGAPGGPGGPGGTGGTGGAGGPLGPPNLGWPHISVATLRKTFS